MSTILERLINKYPKLTWDYENLSYNNISLSFIFNNLDICWNWYSISSIISFEDYYNNKDVKYIRDNFKTTHIENSIWNYRDLSRNENISLDYIENSFYDNTNGRIDVYNDWDWEAITERITYTEFSKYKTLPWDICHLIHVFGIKYWIDNEEFIINNKYQLMSPEFDINEYKDIMIYYSMHNISTEEFIKYYDLFTDKQRESFLSMIEYIDEIPFNFIIEKYDIFNNWNIKLASKFAPYDVFINNYHREWDYNLLLENKNIPINFFLTTKDEFNIRNHLHEKIIWVCIYYRITYNDFINNPDLPWDYSELFYYNSESYDEFIEKFDIKNNLDINWDWKRLTNRVSFDYILTNLDLPWDKNMIFIKEDITNEFLEEIIEKNIETFLIKNYCDDPYEYEMNDSIIDDPDNLDLYKKYYNFNKCIYELSQNKLNYGSYYDSDIYKKKLAKKIMDSIINNDSYYAKVFNPNRKRSYMSICEIEELYNTYNWTRKEFDEIIT